MAQSGALLSQIPTLPSPSDRRPGMPEVRSTHAGPSGGTPTDRDRFDSEAERLRFQTGQAKVCVFTTVASISLHAGETLAMAAVRARTRESASSTRPASRASPDGR
jgi:hypothetical protein